MSERRATKDVAGEIAHGHARVPKLDPEDAVIIGADEPDHPCFDPSRIGAVDDAWVAALGRLGVKVPIIIWKDDAGRWCVVEGRRRVLGLRAANKIAAKTGAPAHRILAHAVQGEAKEIAALKVTLNVARKDYSPLALAEHVTMLNQRFNLDDGELAIMFGKTRQTILNWKALASVAEPVKDAVRTGKMTARTAIELSGAPRDVQVARLSEIVGDAAQTVPADDSDGAALDPVDDGSDNPTDPAPAIEAPRKAVKGKAAVETARKIARGESATDVPSQRKIGGAMAKKFVAEWSDASMGKEGQIAAATVLALAGDAAAFKDLGKGDLDVVGRVISFMAGNPLAFRGYPDLLAGAKRCGWEKR